MAAGVMLGIMASVYLLVAGCGVISRVLSRRQIDRLSEDLLKARLRTALAEQSDREQVHLHWNGLRKFLVDRKVAESRDTTSFYLKPHDSKPLPLFHAGQFLTFRLHVPGESRPVVRCYSLSSVPDTETYRITVKKVAGGVASQFLHESVEVGDLLDVMAPRGDFCIEPSHNRPTVLLAGGVGITPLLSMAYSMTSAGAVAETWLIYSVKTAADFLLRDELRALTEDNPHLHLRLGTSSSGDACAATDFQGRISVDYLNRTLASNNYDFYICGPPPMMKSLVADLREWGVPPTSIHTEAFGASSVQVLSAAMKSETEGESRNSGDVTAGHSVNFLKSCKTGTWNDATPNLLSFAESLDINIDAGCRAGSCGSCVTAIRSGCVKYLETPGYSCDDNTCLPCVAIPDGQLDLDA
ncbi:MAG: 2Fe-2S iron-sulfur cluster binding domain-containing protein [Fuerstiella sp.]|nr:2Fe-2S iron-sulfur cluster binding domain-containing protein [Fuerstiella sp.]MCP4508613.1 2Fe-2S iron-sulfur cluster binding domain-containing protein [Fuerstiella sp.]